MIQVQLKTDCYNYKIFYVRLVVTIKPKPIVDAESKRKKGFKAYCYRKSSNHKGTQQIEEERNYTNQQENDRMTAVILT